MLISANELMGYVLTVEDGEIGRCKDFLFDDRQWVIRYMLADTRKWLPGRKVLISPISLGKPEWSEKCFPVRLTRDQIKDSPPLDEDAAVSRRYEIKWFEYYGWPDYWTGGGLWGAAPYPSMLYLKRLEKATEKNSEPEESHLRSVDEVTGYQIQATDGRIGHLDDLMIDQPAWALRYLVVATRNLLPDRKVLIALDWSRSVDWITRTVTVDLTREAVRNSPEYDPSTPVNREYETTLYDYYGRPRYWK